MCFPSLIVSSPLLVVVSQLHFNICSPVLFCSSCLLAFSHPLSLIFLVCSRTYTVCSQSRLFVFLFSFSFYLIVIICHSLITYFVACPLVPVFDYWDFSFLLAVYLGVLYLGPSFGSYKI